MGEVVRLTQEASKAPRSPAAAGGFDVSTCARVIRN